MTGSSEAAPTTRLKVALRGDLAVIGNTLGHDCGSLVPTPVVGSVGTCGANTSDSAPDVLWKSESPTATTAETSSTLLPTDARSTAVLSIPSTATVQRAHLYWAGKRAAGADTTVTFERPGVFSQSLTASQQFTNNGAYQAVTTVTELVAQYGNGSYRVTGVDFDNFTGLNDDTAFAGWWLVVVYAEASQPIRYLAVYDGLEFVGSELDVSFTGFSVPTGAGTQKIGTIVFDGDPTVTGDCLVFDSTRLSDNANPAVDFANSTHSFMGSASTTAGDLPQLSGAAGSMSGMDLDMWDVTSLLPAGRTTANIKMSTTGDTFWWGGAVASFETTAPSFNSSQVVMTDVNGGALKRGDAVDFVVTIKNDGTDSANKTELTADLPEGLKFVPGSLEITAGPNTGAKTDASGDDTGEYLSAQASVRFRIGTGANATVGGTFIPGASSTVKFRTTVKTNATAKILGSMRLGYETALIGSTNSFVMYYTVNVDACATDADCPAATPACDTPPTPNVCVGCLTDTHCPGLRPTCNTTANTCSCIASGSELCDGKDNDCNGTIDDGANALCVGQANGLICRTFSGSTTCGCSVDGDCGSSTSGKICDPTTKLCVSGCGGSPRNGCPVGQFCTSATTSPGVCTSTCTLDAQCIAVDPTKSRCLLVDGGMNICVECALDAHCAGRMDARVLCVGSNNTCAECSATRKERCSATSKGTACLSSGFCGCILDSDCSSDRGCTQSACELRITTDAGNDAAADASDSGPSDSGQTGDATSGTDAESVDGTPDATVDGGSSRPPPTGSLEGGGPGCAVGPEPTTAFGLFATLAAFASALVRRNLRRARGRARCALVRPAT